MLFAADLERELESHGGDIWAVSPIQLEPRRRPLFTPTNGYLTMGPTVLLNDVEQISYHVSNYSIDTLGNWQGDFFVAVIDHFGLDDEDPTHRRTLVDPIDLWFIETGRISTPVYQDLDDGFASWWILQHRRGYLPFITRMRFVFTLSGRINL